MNVINKILLDNDVIRRVDTHNKFACDNLMQEAILIAGSYIKKEKKIMIVKPNAYLAQQLFSMVSSLVGEDKVILYTTEESLRIEGVASSPELTAQRVFILNELLDDKPRIVITHTHGLIRCIPSRELYLSNCIKLKTNDIVDRKELISKLENLGYKKTLRVEQSLEYSYRGSIIDIFSINYPDPIRIEFFDTEVESIRFFDVNEQKTKSVINDINILAASELSLPKDVVTEGIKRIEKKLEKELEYIPTLSMKEKLKESVYNHIEGITSQNYDSVYYHYYSMLNEECASILDFFKPDQTFLSSYGGIKNSYNLYRDECFAYLEEMNSLGESMLHLSTYLDLEFVLKKINKAKYIDDMAMDSDTLTLDCRDVISCHGNSTLFQGVMDTYMMEGKEVYLCLLLDSQIENVKMWLEEADLLEVPSIHVIKGNIEHGFELAKERIVFLTQRELFGTSTKASNFFNKYKSASILTSYQDLVPFDYVVHEQHGIGQYLGIKTMEMDGCHKDYLHIVYKGNNALYIPLEQFKLVRKYVGKDGRVPSLNKLGSSEWEKTKAKVKKKINDIADKLIVLYQERAKTTGYAFSEEDELERSFDNDFPYKLTKDQQKAIDDTKRDMENGAPMDRLVCGVVGFGKTEIAFRAAFKAIKDGKQVAMLCPTTILARQHYYKAIERFQNFDVNIEVLSRLVSDKKVKQIMKKLEEGKINFVIGTHKLLNKDIKFKDLGLLIVDEEQRFGVEHKERIKEMKVNIDVLTLSATPIPRTLQMALVGIRSLSQIQTAPTNRFPVQTYIIEHKDEVIKEIIERELGRGGQVFYLHNKTYDLVSLATKIQKSIPNAKVAIGHGQMDKDTLEDVMLDFYNGESNVLVCTTIIESGIDIPNANTIIVDDADNFGLSQLYQIKGRVGRSDRIAYAYLLYKPRKQMSEIAQKRLQSIKEFTELGSGYKIALRDLSIRGAGDILGAEQAGFIDDVGIDMYLSLLDEAIKERSASPDKIKKVVKAPKVMQLDSYVPIEFASEDANKFAIYKEIEKVETLGQLEELKVRIKDNYGTIIKPVELLLEKKKIDILSTQDCVDKIDDNPGYMMITLNEEFSKYNGVGVDLFKLVNEIDGNSISLSFIQDRIKVRLDKKGEWANNLTKLLIGIIDIDDKYKKEATN